MVNFSGVLVASRREYVGDSQEWMVAGGLFAADLLFLPKPKQQRKLNQFVNLVCFENVSHITIENIMRQIFGEVYFSEFHKIF